MTNLMLSHSDACLSISLATGPSQNDVDDAFDKRDVKRVAGILLGMQRSLMVLSDVPDYAQRKNRLVELQNKLEAILSPRLMNAFTSHLLGMGYRRYLTTASCSVERNLMKFGLSSFCSYLSGT